MLQNGDHVGLRLPLIVVPVDQRVGLDQIRQRVQRGPELVEGQLAREQGFALQDCDDGAEQRPARGVVVPGIDLESVDVSGVRPAAPGLRDELPRVLQEPLTPGLHIHARPRPPET